MVASTSMSPVVEQRRYARAPINSPSAFSLNGKSEKTDGLVKDISVGGMFIETTAPAAFGSDVVVHVTLPGANDPLALPGVVRWVRDGGMGVQFGLLGAKETHIITEIGRKFAETGA
jgi:Tfp pilus assembly protein PilZ